MESYKQEYNYLLKRYYKGCNYIKDNPQESEKLMPELLKILDKMNIILEENNINNNDIILNGFKD